MTAFYKFKHIIARDQYLRAHDRGERPMTNPDYTFRRALGLLYYHFRPKYWWWFIMLVSRKFLLVVNSILFRGNSTFQMSTSLGFLFIFFCCEIIFWPYLGMKERAEIIRKECEDKIFLEVQKLEKAQRIAKISGKAYYDIIHKRRLQMDIQTEFIQKHVKVLYNYNVFESILLGSTVLINLS